MDWSTLLFHPKIFGFIELADRDITPELAVIVIIWRNTPIWLGIAAPPPKRGRHIIQGRTLPRGDLSRLYTVLHGQQRQR